MKKKSDRAHDISEIALEVLIGFAEDLKELYKQMREEIKDLNAELESLADDDDDDDDDDLDDD